MITFSFRPTRWSTLPLIAASVRTLVVSWKDADEEILDDVDEDLTEDTTEDTTEE